MHVIAQAGNDRVATVYVARFDRDRRVEFVESVQPPLPRERKWVLIVSTLFGCPVRCRICDAGGSYRGKLSAEQIFAQIDFMIRRRYPAGAVPADKFKIQFARMGEPAFNRAVLDVLRDLPRRYHAPGLIPSLSTIAPAGRDHFFAELLTIKNRLYQGGCFQLQFSLHSTDDEARAWLMPGAKWDLPRIAAYGAAFHRPGDRKITLNFALARDIPLDPALLARYFDPVRFLVKITPLNPTLAAARHGLTSWLDPHAPHRSDALVQALRARGYEVILSIGELEENRIGSNCGQYVRRAQRASTPADTYTYPVQPVGATGTHLPRPGGGC